MQSRYDARIPMEDGGDQDSMKEVGDHGDCSKTEPPSQACKHCSDEDNL